MNHGKTPAAAWRSPRAMIEAAAARGATNAATNQPFILNLGEVGGATRSMGAWKIHAQSQGFERDAGLRNYGRRGRKNGDVSNRAGGRSTAEWAVLKMSVRSRMVVLRMRRHLRLVGGGTHFQQKRRTACRHEADGHIGPKQECDQQHPGAQASPPGIKWMLPHDPQTLRQFQ